MTDHADVRAVGNGTDDKQRVLHTYNVETLYNHVVNSYVEWQTAVVEAIIRANSGNSPKSMFVQQERCVWKLTCLLYMADSYRAGQGAQRCQCPKCGFARALRSYLAHHWTRKTGDFALRGSSWRTATVLVNRGDLHAEPDERVASGLSLFLYVHSVQPELKRAIEKLGWSEDPVDVVPIVDYYVMCVAESHRAWRQRNPVAKAGTAADADRGHDYDRDVLIDISNEIRERTEFPPGIIDLYGNARARSLRRRN